MSIKMYIYIYIYIYKLVGFPIKKNNFFGT